MASNDEIRGKHARHAASNDETRAFSRPDVAGETQRIESVFPDDDFMVASGDYGMDGASQSSRNEEMTQAFDALYGGRTVESYYPESGFKQGNGYRNNGSSWQDQGYRQADYGQTRRFDQAPAYDYRAARDEVGGSNQQYSDASYVNNSGNAQVMGFAKKPGKQIDMNPKKTKRENKRRQKEQRRMEKQTRRNSSRGGSGLLRKLITLLIILAIPICVYGYLLDQELAIPQDQRDAVEDALQPAGVFKPFYVLVLGSDSREGSGTSSDPAMSGDNERSDVILLLRVDPLKDQITMVSVPRDTPYRADDGTLMKINETYNYGGAAETIRAVSEVTGVGINHYVEVGFSDLENIVDAIGGVTVDVNTTLGYNDALTGDYVTIEEGTQTLDGQAAQIFARARHEYGDNQDMNRQNNVRILFSSIFKGILDRPFWEIPGTVLRVAHYVTTDMKSYNFATMALSMLLHPGSTTIYSCTGPYDGEINYEAGGLWLCYENPEGWSNLMSIVDAGEDPSQYDLGY